MSVQLAVAPIAWSNSDLPQLGDTPLETCLRESREAGFTGTESGAKYPMDPEKLGPLLQEYDLKLASGWFSGTLRECTVDEEWENLQEMLYTFKSLQAPVLVYAETSGSVQTKQQIPVSQRPVMPDEEYPGMDASSLKLLTEWQTMECRWSTIIIWVQSLRPSEKSTF